METLLKPNFRIKTQEQQTRKLQELFLLLEVKAQLYKLFETQGCTLNDVLLTVYIIQI